MPQFTPADADDVAEHLKPIAKGGDVGHTGHGLMYVLQESKTVHALGLLTESHGWAVTTIYENKEADEVLVQVEPIEEVNVG